MWHRRTVCPCPDAIRVLPNNTKLSATTSAFIALHWFEYIKNILAQCFCRDSYTQLSGFIHNCRITHLCDFLPTSNWQLVSLVSLYSSGSIELANFSLLALSSHTATIQDICVSFQKCRFSICRQWHTQQESHSCFSFHWVTEDCLSVMLANLSVCVNVKSFGIFNLWATWLCDVCFHTYRNTSVIYQWHSVWLSFLHNFRTCCNTTITNCKTFSSFAASSHFPRPYLYYNEM